MKKRKRLPIRWARKLLAKQDNKCAVKGCSVELILGDRGQHTNFIDEHIVALGRGGTNALKNRELRCIDHADRKTNRPRSKATTISGDIYEIRKTPRLKRKHTVRKPPTGTLLKPKTKKHPWCRWHPLGKPKMQGRGFAKVSRPMRSQKFTG